jgi:tetratricopeptide (TPR) repeat protein
MRYTVLVFTSLIFSGLSAPALAQLGMLERNFENYGYQTTEELNIIAFANVGGGNCMADTPEATIRQCTRNIIDRQALYNTRDARPRRATWYTIRANAHAELGEIEDVERDYQRAITQYPDGLWIYASRAQAYENIRDYEMVLDSLFKAQEVAPDSPIILAWIALYLAVAPDDNLRDGAQAVAKAQWAIELATGNLAIFVDTPAAAYAETGDFMRAVEEERRAIKMLPPGDPATAMDFQNSLENYMH